MHNKLFPNLVISRIKILYSQFLWAGIHEWIGWVFLAQGLLSGCSQGIGWGCIIWKLHWTEWSTSTKALLCSCQGALSSSLTLGKKPQFFLPWASPQAASILNMSAGCPQIKWFKTWGNLRTAVSFMMGPRKSHIVCFTISYWLHRWVLFSIGVDYTRMWKPGSGDPCGPSGKLATTVR